MSGLLISGPLNILLNRLTAVRAGYLDLLDTLNSRLTATRAGYLDNLTRLDAVISTAPVGARIRLFTSSTTWVSPAASTQVMVVAVGGGGGGAQFGSGTAGGTTSFGALVSASGGSGGSVSSPGTTGYARGAKSDQAAEDTIYLPSLGGSGFLAMGQGGPAMAYWDPSDTSYTGFGGNSGAVAVYTGTVAASTSITVTIGAGGAGKSESGGGRKGSAGAVLLLYW